MGRATQSLRAAVKLNFLSAKLERLLEEYMRNPGPEVLECWRGRIEFRERLSEQGVVVENQCYGNEKELV